MNLRFKYENKPLGCLPLRANMVVYPKSYSRLGQGAKAVSVKHWSYKIHHLVFYSGADFMAIK